MANYYDNDSVIERLNNIKGVVLLREEYDAATDVSANVYEGINGDMVVVDTSEEEVSEDTVNGYLQDLGLCELIGCFLPPLPSQITPAQQPDWDLANSFLENTEEKDKASKTGNQSSGKSD